MRAAGWAVIAGMLLSVGLESQPQQVCGRVVSIQCARPSRTATFISSPVYVEMCERREFRLTNAEDAGLPYLRTRQSDVVKRCPSAAPNGVTRAGGGGQKWSAEGTRWRD